MSRLTTHKQGLKISHLGANGSQRLIAAGILRSIDSAVWGFGLAGPDSLPCAINVSVVCTSIINVKLTSVVNIKPRVNVYYTSFTNILTRSVDSPTVYLSYLKVKV